MNYTGTLKYFERLERFGIKLGLENIKRLLNLSGNPESGLSFIHIAGTNGKGSTARFISEILEKAGYRVGLYTSPHLERFEERIMVNGKCVSKKDLSSLATYYQRLLKREKNFSPTYFEVTTAIALKYFSEKKVDICVLEVGLGGRLDATNIVKPEVCIITSIAQDHVQYLGSRISDIAGEKFSIVKPGAGAIASLSQRVLKKKLRDICRKGENPLMLVGEDIGYTLHKADLNGQVFTLKIASLLHQMRCKIRLLGHHQIVNAALAVGGVLMLSQRGFKVSLENIREGLEDTTWPGRFEVLKKRPYIVLDGAHNLEAIKKLKEALKFYFSDRRVILILGIMADKDWPHIISTITPMANLVITCTIDSERACPSKDIAGKARRFNKNVAECSSSREAISMALKKAGRQDLVCITGSLYLIGEAKKFLKKIL